MNYEINKFSPKYVLVGTIQCWFCYFYSSHHLNLEFSMAIEHHPLNILYSFYRCFWYLETFSSHGFHRFSSNVGFRMIFSWLYLILSTLFFCLRASVLRKAVTPTIAQKKDRESQPTRAQTRGESFFWKKTSILLIGNYSYIVDKKRYNILHRLLKLISSYRNFR